MGVRLGWDLRGARAWLIALGIFLPALTALGSWKDGTLHSATDFVGLLGHPGYWAMFILTPCIIFLTGRMVDEFSGAIRNTRSYCIDEYQPEVDELAQRHLNCLEFGARYWPLRLIVAAFLGCWILNFLNTSSASAAKASFGDHVFDSALHPYGFYFAKLYLLFIMVVVYSSAVFAAASVAVSMNSIFAFINRNNALRIDLFDLDHCGGLSRFGNINIIALSIVALFSVISLATALTHTKLYVVMLWLFPLYLVAGFTQSWIALRLIARSVAREKRRKLQIATSRLRLDAASLLNGGEFSSDLLVLRNYLLTIRNYPYPAQVRLYFVSAFSPIAAIAGLLKAIFIH
jgi:hypothetical protein